MSVHLHIERLVLDGVVLDRLGRRKLEAALREQLAGALAEQWLATQAGAHLARVAAAPVTMGMRVDGQALGQAIGQALASALGRP